MATETSAILTLSRWLSPSYPVGAYSYSHGLESAAQSGTVSDAATLQSWLHTVLEHGAGHNDVILIAAAYRTEYTTYLFEIDEFSRALSPSHERLQETVLQGEAFAKTTSVIEGLDIPPLTYPVAIGCAASLKSLPLDLTAKMYLQAFTSNLISAAIRLGCLGQTEGQSCLANLAPLCETIVDTALSMSLDDLGSSAFMVDLAAMKHETQYSRIFRS